MRLPHDHLIGQRMKAPLMRSLNGIELLNLIAEHGPVSRAGLAKLSRLSKPTVSSQVETLVQQGWVVELGQGESGAKGGKKPTMIRFNADAGRLFAVEIDSEEIRIAVADLEGKILDKQIRPTEGDRRADSILDRVCRDLGELIERERFTGAQKVISVASPGRVDVRRGITIDAGNLFNWSQVAIRERLEVQFNIPVLVDNNVKMATLGELYFGVAKGMTDAIVVRLDSGIGSGVVVRGRLIHGRHWAAGEIAHMNLDLARVSEEWSVRGYLESMVAADRILAEAPEGQASAVEFMDLARQSHDASRKLFDKVVLHVGAAIGNLICVYDPSIVVLQGELLAQVVAEVRDVVARAVPWQTRIEVSKISADAVLLGTLSAARALAYERIAKLFNGRERTAGVRGRPAAQFA
ncbi:MAG: ROK family transcriptional regulator [Acidobacteria bacterium]|nr:ROK family transcriptional regulator [Acidobacteriota bacterium]